MQRYFIQSVCTFNHTPPVLLRANSSEQLIHFQFQISTGRFSILFSDIFREWSCAFPSILCDPLITFIFKMTSYILVSVVKPRTKKVFRLTWPDPWTQMGFKYFSLANRHMSALPLSIKSNRK